MAGTAWGGSSTTLRTSALALVYAPAEYVCSTWKNSSHIHKIDVQLNQTMRLISGTIKSTNLKWLPVLSNIAPPPPPTIKREVVANRIFNKFKNNEESLLYRELNNPPPVRLKSRKSIFHDMQETPLDEKELWRKWWNDAPPPNHALIQDPTEKVPGFDLPRKYWTTVNRFRTGHGRCNYLMKKWKFVESASCTCGTPEQTTAHIFNECDERCFHGGLNQLHLCELEAVEWLKELDVNF